MTNVWLIAGDASGSARILAERLLEDGDQVAVLDDSTDPLAMPVHKYGSALMSIEVQSPDIVAFDDAVSAITDDLGEVDTFALIGDASENSDFSDLRTFFDQRFPLAELLVIDESQLPHLEPTS